MLTIDLNGKKALVSGVSCGIGAAIALQLARAGCDVAGCATSAANTTGPCAFRKSVEAEGRRTVYHKVDIATLRGPGEWVAQAADAIGGVDIVVSNAGRNIFAGAENCDQEVWSQCMELDLASHWRLAKAAKPYLEKSVRPIIIIISSNHAWRTIPGCFPYNVAKAGLPAMVQSLAIEWAPKIRTVGVAPGFIDTPGNDAWFNSFPDPAAERTRTEKRHPVGRLGTADEIGALCAFLASDHAGFISGTTLLVDGGVGAVM
jgi:NAD(P)-dependent dehydrogenase (short-subunit alcohol dehydrogenase family)